MSAILRHRPTTLRERVSWALRQPLPDGEKLTLVALALNADDYGRGSISDDELRRLLGQG